ncbi:DUF1801 domain-containing protein [Zeaxanthinibacter enoshimensis]|uniref:Uncharacterized protein DUF1801 n=1 Tax=Zeaxanthinibacter enoshimensis TaxID=392009 RepID=A0A4R6TQW3_9FLAO|nr:DUF1801 domain-containing protein [Zeaxanthinibacter enoshimensis]TDQ32513.1 uncharacterized protein DUF1801 [Zeaxanthinibacter enoshimensis]
MTSDATTPEAYIAEIPEERKPYMHKLRDTILKNLPEGFREEMSYGMIGYVVPHELYPPGYHVNPQLPLPFLSIASQKNNLALYHMGIYANPELHDWWVAEYKNRVPSRLDMGKSCIRFKKPEQIPYDLIGELCSKVSVEEWISTYENQIKNYRKK